LESAGKALTECNGVISIFKKNVETVKKNMEAEEMIKQENKANEK
jgi:hypothetical protein